MKIAQRMHAHEVGVNIALMTVQNTYTYVYSSLFTYIHADAHICTRTDVGRVYYFNGDTSETQWDPPTDWIDDAEEVLVQTKGVAPRFVSVIENSYAH